MDTAVLANKQKLTFISFVWTLDVFYTSCQERWPIGSDGVQETWELVLYLHLGQDDDTDDSLPQQL